MAGTELWHWCFSAVNCATLLEGQAPNCGTDVFLQLIVPHCSKGRHQTMALISVCSSSCSSKQPFIRTLNIFIQAQDEVFSLNAALQFARPSCNSLVKFQAGLLWNGPCRAQTQISIAKSLREIFTLFQYYVAHGGNTNISGQYISLNFKEIQKGEHSMIEVSWHNLLFWDCVLHLIFLNKHDILPPCIGKEAPNLAYR